MYLFNLKFVHLISVNFLFQVEIKDHSDWYGDKLISNSYIRLILIFSFLLTWKQKEVFWIACKWGWHSIGPKGPFVMRKLHKISRRDTFSSEIFVIRRNNIHLLRGILDFYKGEPYSHIFLCKPVSFGWSLSSVLSGTPNPLSLRI